ncbi:MAG: IS66 family transposase [Pseudonocardiaceae bacterium]
MAKTASSQLSRELLEQIYSEVETRVSRKFEARIRELEKRCEKAEQERDIWRKKYFKEQEKSRHLEGQLQLANAQIKGLEQLVEKQAAQIHALQKQIHGKKSEVTLPEPTKPVPKRSRGKQQGAQGFGRKRRDHLEPVDCIHDFNEDQRHCPECNLPYNPIGEKVSEQIHVEFKVVRRIHRRIKIAKSCTCPNVPTIKVAPPPEQLFKGSIFSIETWSHVIFDKYFSQRPTHRTLRLLETFGLKVSQGTITNGLKKLHENQVFKPLIDDIKARVIASKFQQKDETGWKVFQETDGKKGYAWWLWVTRTDDCCLFHVDPRRSKDVAKLTIGPDPVVVLTDCLSSYHNLGDQVTNAWCWAHIRRALLQLASFKLESLSESWIKKVDNLYHLNHLRLSSSTDEMYRVYEEQLIKAINDFERQAKRNAVRKGLHAEARKVFSRIADHWDGLTVFVRMPAISMDNNLSEQALRNPVVGRKCYYGSGSQWSAQLAADLFTLFETLNMAGINPRLWLNEYLYAVARSNCQAPINAAAFLPWNTPPSEHLLS